MTRASRSRRGAASSRASASRGVTRGEISGILIGTLAVEVLLAIPIGLLLGRG